MMDKEDVKRELKNAKRPCTLLFGKPLANHQVSILAGIGLARDDVWETSDVVSTTAAYA